MRAYFHPSYLTSSLNWNKYRLTYEGGVDFRDTYLEKYSSRELPEEFASRRSLSYTPAFAKEHVIDIRNSIFARLADISRKGGTKSYMSAVKGENGGVDLEGHSMSAFMGSIILEELLVMAKVGIFVDMPKEVGPTVMDNVGLRPYLYWYRVEDIVSWNYKYIGNRKTLVSLLLRDHVPVNHQDLELVAEYQDRYRYISKDLNTGVVSAYYFDDNGTELEEPVVLGIDEIPFICLELSHSLLTDVADYQIALLNIESSDLNYILKSNFPFYVEQYDPTQDSIKKFQDDTDNEDLEKKAKIQVGATSGRRYPMNTNAPSFIHPSAEPINASMQKTDRMKQDIKELIHLTLSTVEAKNNEQRDINSQGLQAGLSYIGLELQYGESEIARIWSKYEGSKEIATVAYPKKYSLKSDKDRRDDAESLSKLMKQVPSKTFQKEAAKQIIEITIGHRVSNDALEAMFSELDDSSASTSDPDVVLKAVDLGVCDTDLAADLLGYPEGTADKAMDDKVKRAEMIVKAQSDVKLSMANSSTSDGNSTEGTGSIKNPSSRGVNDLEVDNESSRTEERLGNLKSKVMP